MALTATFAADFQSFTQACAKAELSLKGIESGASKVGTQLNRMADSLSGTKIIQQATIAAEAVKRLGGEGGIAAGLLQLTDKELARIGTTAQEAAQKLTRMGQQVPADIQKIADAATEARSKTESFLGTAGKLAGLLGVAFTASAAISGIKNLVGGALDAASQFHDLSLKLGISAEAVQRFSFVAAQTGSDIDTFGRAIGFMNKTLDGGDKSTVAALKAAGLEFDNVRAMKPEQAFEAITEAIRQIPDPMTQARVAVELFGKAGQDLLPGIKEGIKGIAAQTSVMSDETVRQLEAAQDAWQKFGNQVTIATGTMLAGVMSDFEMLRKNLRYLIEDIKHPFSGAGQAMAAQERAMLAPLTAVQEETIKGMAKFGRTADEIAPMIQKPVDVVQRYMNTLKPLVPQMAAASSAQRSLASAAKVHADSMLKVEYGTDRLFAKFPQLVGAWKDETKAEQDAIKADKDAAKAAEELESAYRRMFVGVTDGSGSVAKVLARFPDYTKVWTEATKVQEKEVSNLEKAYANLGKTIIAAIQGGGNVGASIGASLLGGLGEDLGAKIAKKIGGQFGGAIGGIFGPLGSLVGGALGGLADKVFGKILKTEGKQVNDMRDQWMAAQGGLSAVQAKIAESGNDPKLVAAFNKLYNTGKVKEFQSAVEELAKREQELGLERDKKAQEFAASQDKLVKGASGLTASIGVQADAYAELKKAVQAATDSGDPERIEQAQNRLKNAVVTTQGEFDRLSRIELSAFNTLVASGVDSVTAMGEVGAGIDNLIKSAETFGLSGNSAFDSLKRWRELTEQNAPLLDQIGSLNDILMATANLGGLTADSFADIEAQGVSAFEQLTAAGLSQQEAEMALKPLLESILQLHKDKGLAIDENTQALIDQAKADGVLQDKEESTQQVLKEGLGAIIKLLKGDLPDAWKKTTDAGIEAAKNTKTEWDKVKINVPVDFQYKIPEMPSFPGEDTSGPPVFPQASGGDYLVTKPTLFLAGEAGPERATFSGAGNTSGGGITVVVNIDAKGSFLATQNQADDLTQIIAQRLPVYLRNAGMR